MEVPKPSRLAEVWSLSRNLKSEPLFLVVLLWRFAVRDLVILIVVLDKIIDDGPRLPERDTCVWVFDGRDTTVGIDADEGLLLD